MSEQQSFQQRIELPVEFVPQRVVSLAPSITETLFDLDLGERLIARTNYCVRPADKVQSIPSVGGTQNPDIQAIVQLQPELVILSDVENRREDADALKSSGIPIWVTGPRTVFDTLNLLWTIMHVFDHAAMVPRVREIERAYDYTWGAAQLQEPVRVLVPMWQDGWITFNAQTYAHDILRTCGGYNVFAEREQTYARITLEEVVATHPEVMLFPDTLAEQQVESLRGLDIPRVYRVDSSLITWPGTRTGYALRDLPSLLVGESQGE